MLDFTTGYILQAQLCFLLSAAVDNICTSRLSFAGSHAGPVLLEDYHLIEKLAQFDRERIPERVVHARGATAKGFFEV